jgi:hypothetical protein
MTPVGDIEIEVVLSLVIRARAKDLVPLFNVLSSGQQFMVIVVEDSSCYENQHKAPVPSK